MNTELLNRISRSCGEALLRGELIEARDMAGFNRSRMADAESVKERRLYRNAAWQWHLQAGIILGQIRQVAQ